jgi:preprotein translocase subunit SecD
MNRYPLWKNLLIGLVLLWGLIYTLPNFYGEVPAVQVSSAKATIKLDTAATTDRIANALKGVGIENTGIFADAEQRACPLQATPKPSSRPRT